MYVRAISIGHAVPRMQFDAVVHSVFASAVNLQPVAGGQMLTLLASADGDSPQGIRLDAWEQWSPDRLQAGMRAACRNGLLHFDGHPLTVDLREATCWDAGLPVLQVDLREAGIRAAWQCAWEALDKRQAEYASELRASQLLAHEAASDTLWVQRASRSIHQVLRATFRGDSRDIAAIQDLIGLGPGLTPAGDDLTAGYLLGLRYATRGGLERIEFFWGVRSAVLEALDRAGDISRTYLYYAARGEPSGPIFGLVSAICSGASESTVLERAEAAMSLGHTSGMDVVMGLLLGAAAWDAPELLGISSQ